MKLIAKLLLTIFSLLLVAHFVPGIEVSGFYIALIVAILLGVVNVIIKPILYIVTLPLNILTLGLFTFVINAFLFWFVSTFIDGFTVIGFIPALVGAAIVSVLSSIGNRIL
jgi:putative membrane protein